MVRDEEGKGIAGATPEIITEHQGIQVRESTTVEQIQALTMAQGEANEARLAVIKRTGTENEYDLKVMEVLRRWFLITRPESTWREICRGMVVNRLLHTGKELDDLPDLKESLSPEEIQEIKKAMEIPLLANCEIKEEELRRILELYKPEDINYFDQQNLPGIEDITDLADEGESLVMDVPSENRLALFLAMPHDPRSQMILAQYRAKDGLLRYRILTKADLKLKGRRYDPTVAMPLDEWLADTFMDSEYKTVTEARGDLAVYFLDKNMGGTLVKRSGTWTLSDQPTERGWSRIGLD